MKSISGKALSLISDALRKVNEGGDRVECAQAVSAAILDDSAVINLPDGPAASLGRPIDAGSMSRLNVLLPWTSYNAIEGGVIGTAFSTEKRLGSQVIPDRRITVLNEMVGLRNCSVLEAGCYEGHHTASLVQFSKDVWAFDGRIENVIKTLTRLWALGLERSAVVQLIDIEKEPVSKQLSGLGRKTTFDLIHHRGVLYHLSRPVEHIEDLSRVCAKHLYLHTQVAHDEVCTMRETPLGPFAMAKHLEPHHSYAAFAGTADHSVRLSESSLIAVLRAVGFGDVKIMDKAEGRYGLRIELLASR